MIAASRTLAASPIFSPPSVHQSPDEYRLLIRRRYISGCCPACACCIQAGCLSTPISHVESLASIHRPIKILRFLRFDSIYDLIIYDLIQFSSTFDLRCKKPHGLPRGFCRDLIYQVFPRGFPCGELLHGNPHGKPCGGLVVQLATQQRRWSFEIKDTKKLFQTQTCYSYPW